MPRGRKGSPQDSIDSILLAISRRDDIDSATLSHYLDRLDEEWTQGAREKVLHLLHTSDASAHAAAIMVLSEIATDFDLDELEEVIADPTVSDLAKLSLGPVLKELGSEMAEDGIVEYLNDPISAIHQMQQRLLELVDRSEMGIESILEDVTSMPVERRLGFIAWLGSSHDPRAAHLLIPLLEHQPAKIGIEIIDALEQLGSLAFQHTIPALNHLMSTTSNRELKQHARVVLGRLTMQSAPGAEDAAMTEAREQALPPYDARVSFVDGAGSQLIMLSWRRPDDLLKGVNVLYQDQWGIKDCYGVDEITMERWDTLVADLDKQGFNSFKTPFDYASALIVEARALNKRTRHKLPVAYSVWRPAIEGNKPNKKTSTSVALARLPVDETTLALAQRGGELFLLPEFASWMYEPPLRVEPYMVRYWALSNPFDPTNRNKRGGKRSKGKAKDAEKEHAALLEELVTEALTALIDDKWRTIYDARLRHQAALFQIAGREQEATLIQAVATVLHPTSNIPIQEQAFPRTILRITIEQGPLRIIAESLNADDLGPLDLFEDE